MNPLKTKSRDIPTYELPKLILDQLGIQPPKDWIPELLSSPPQKTFRPVKQGVFVINSKGDEIFCPRHSSHGVCRQAKTWRKNIGIINQDLILGDQLSLKPQE